MKQEMKEQRRCSQCGSTQTYINFSENARVCRSCGLRKKLEEKKE
jgi:uncharacterized protein (DUF983 family)